MRTVNPEQHARKRAKILAAAAREFAAGGVEGTSTAAICRRAGIGSGTLFHYFPTKREIFHALFADDLAGNADVCAAALAHPVPEDGLDRLVDHLVGDLADPLLPGLAAAALLQANRDVEFATLLADDEARTLRTLKTLLTRIADAGGRPRFPPARAARWTVSLIDATFLAVSADDFDPVSQATELRALVAWLTGRS